MKKEKRKKLNKGRLIFTIIVIVLIIILIMYLYSSIFSKINTQPKTIKVTDEIKEFGYVLEDTETDLYKSYFKELSEELNNKDEDDIDYEKYAELISKLYVSDFYNLDNKITKNDVGGLQFIHEDMQENFLLKAKDTIYKNIESDVYDNRDQDLPVVSEVTTDEIEETTYDYNDVEYDAYNVTLSWQYKEDLGYDDEKIFTAIKDGKKLWLVESKSIDNSDEE